MTGFSVAAAFGDNGVSMTGRCVACWQHSTPALYKYLSWTFLFFSCWRKALKSIFYNYWQDRGDHKTRSLRMWEGIQAGQGCREKRQRKTGSEYRWLHFRRREEQDLKVPVLPESSTWTGQTLAKAGAIVTIRGDRTPAGAVITPTNSRRQKDCDPLVTLGHWRPVSHTPPSFPCAPRLPSEGGLLGMACLDSVG